MGNFPIYTEFTKVCNPELSYQSFLEEFMNIIQRRFMRYGLSLLSLAAGLTACGGGGSNTAASSAAARATSSGAALTNKPTTSTKGGIRRANSAARCGET
jgi:hypothetical protein